MYLCSVVLDGRINASDAILSELLGDDAKAQG
jgi:hypothetical protein